MNAIVPLNIAALRVNNNDATNVVGELQGKTAKFSAMPWNNPAAAPPTGASTGDKIYAPLANSNGKPLNSPADPLGTGIHLQWALPDYFNQGMQDADGANPVFPAAPNRWLVTRFLSFFDAQSGTYGSISSKSWVVESDYLAPTLTADPYGIIRPAISVPVPAFPGYQKQPFMYMGRVVDASAWDPATESAADYLPSHQGPDGKPLQLTAIGFVGAYFGAYYPECCSVFGFWDHFSDVPCSGYASLYEALQANAAIQFRVGYQVTGWLNESQTDPLADIDALVKTQYDNYVAQCRENQVAPVQNPNDFFQRTATEKMKWSFNMADLSYQLNPDLSIASLNYPQETLVAGTTQEIVWDMASNPGTTYFLESNSAANKSVWNTQVEIAVGNSTEEAVAAMFKSDMGQKTDDKNVLNNYEYLLDALQLGVLPELENTPNKLIALEEALHDNAFANYAGGYLWIVGSKEVNSSAPVDPDAEVSLPLDLAEQLYLLNQAQKDYDMGRAALIGMRQQLFMDWTHYIKMYTGEISDPNINPNSASSLNTMTAFLSTSSGGEIKTVIAKGNAVGILSYATDPVSGVVTGILAPVSGVAPDSLAYVLWQRYSAVQQALANYADWQLQCAKSSDFFMPNEPVVLMQGDMLEPVARNGKQNLTSVRLSQEILAQLEIGYANSNFVLNTGQVSEVPRINANIPMQADVQALMGEAFLITPMLAGALATALAAQGGNDNPALQSRNDFTTSLMYAQGGFSPLELLPHPGGLNAPGDNSLFALVHAENYQAAPNPVVAVTLPQALVIGFSNASQNGWVPAAVGWTTQATPAGFPASHVNPFLPVFMIWNVRLNPLIRENQSNQNNPLYGNTNITDFFQLDSDAVDYVYKTDGGKAVSFTSPQSVEYGNSATMSANSNGVLTYQIASYIGDHPDDPDRAVMEKIASLYTSKKLLAQSISGFNNGQVLNAFIAQIPVADLTKGPRDTVTTALASAALQNSWDNWYHFGFNDIQPLSTGLLAQNNFGPLRAGFMEVLSIEIVDAFGQRMDVNTAKAQADGALDVMAAASLTPPASDTDNQGKIYLPPRVLAPTRLWLQWLSASYDPAVPGIHGDFEEMSQSPATSPVCGWIMPNHLDNNLFFYDEQGRPIGSFGIEHVQTNPTLVYRTKAGNLANPGNNLALDIGAAGQPLVNANLANYMWYLNQQNAYYMQDLINAIANSSNFINPDSYTHDTALSVLIGRPLALTRIVAGLETAGNLLPLSQADYSPDSAFPQDVNQQRVDYYERMQYSSANLQQVNFPLRMGDLANFDDGMIGYLIEGESSNPYLGQTFYAPAASGSMQNGVVQPTETSLQLNLNGAALHLTMLVDPLGAVHATTGVLPVSELRIPVAQYATALQNIAVSFVTRPMLKMAQTFIVPLPGESAYSWSWITPGAAATTALVAAQANETPVYGYSPQTLQEGWLELSPTTEKDKQ